MTANKTKTVGRKRKSTPSRSERLNVLIASTRSAGKQIIQEPEHAKGSHISEGGFETFIQANTTVLDALAALQTEMLTFGGKRLSANIERSQSLARCEHFEQAIRIESEFFESAVQHYLDQTDKVLEIMASMTWGFWWPPAREPLDRTPEPPSPA